MPKGVQAAAGAQQEVKTTVRDCVGPRLNVASTVAMGKVLLAVMRVAGCLSRVAYCILQVSASSARTPSTRITAVLSVS